MRTEGLEEGAKLTLAEVVDRTIRNKGYRSRRQYLKRAVKDGLIEIAVTGQGWIRMRRRITLFYLNKIVQDLDIPRQKLVQIYGRDPFLPPIQEFRESDRLLGSLLDWYIDLRTGKTRSAYLKEIEGILIEKASTTRGWFSGSDPFPLHYLKNIVDDLNIPVENLAELYACSPFAPPIEEFKKSNNPLGKLLDWYIGFRLHKTRGIYLKEKECSLKINAATVKEWFKKSSASFCLNLLDKIVKDMNIDLNELTLVYVNPANDRLTPYIIKEFMTKFSVPKERIIEACGSDPFIPPFEEFRKDAFPLGRLLDWYVEFRTGKKRQTYLKEIEGSLVTHALSARAWFSGKNSFPPRALKAVVDDLQIPYDEVNQFIDYDISNPFEVNLRSKCATPEQMINSAFEDMQFPADPESLLQLVSVIGGDADSGLGELVDLLYLIRPTQIMALESKKIGKQEVKDFLKGYLSSASGNSSGVVGGSLPPFITIARVIPYETFQRNSAVRNHLLDLSLKAYMSIPYDAAVQRINSQLALHSDDKVLQNVLSETKDYLKQMNIMPTSITGVGN